ncbi:UDP-N-acetylmuramoyl-L-alanine--D-glutamate ligase [Candidatus Palibaumannia cicadellinicola]|uniref:UDP-N-acetylmuramoylalanine--D-glutamate ligase n=1 Tax=Candidatus Palibaumannia cicadellinicola TaxID=186490 RepID=A0A0K2BL00_9GAMM|nr:UDP-N-acetylmuramoyl-L-alanine--D-glutamate ligase [Candidatus Baumannia cicadellinicola]AKZ66051.1 UDP-N-acetylmuramoylalanine--D-glutamate ligase [Candidatus Baumannia cicadellinicola]
MNYHNKNIIIIGLGITGISCVNFFLKKGILPRVMDTNYHPPELNNLPKHVEYCLGYLNKDWLFKSHLIVISPGISLYHPEIQAAAKIGIEIVGDIELFLREVKSPVVAITGTNGKSTVATLVGQMATAAGIKVGVCGNIGNPALLMLENYYQLYVLELSSFQLEITKNLKIAVATILNISEDHMNRYPLGFMQYLSAKLKIYQHADIAVVNTAYPITFPLVDYKNKSKQFIVSFGAKSGYYSIGYKNGKQWLMAYGEPLLDCNEIKMFGIHNKINALAALALAEQVYIPRKACLRVLRTFVGLSHCLELVLDSKGIRWINDSKSTNVGSTTVAINEFQFNLKGKLHLLLGGDTKLANLSPLLHLLKSSSNIQLYCFGKDCNKLAALKPNVATTTETLAQSMYIIEKKVKPGDVVLLSPACSSLDQFANFKVRGKAFRKLVLDIS